MATDTNTTRRALFGAAAAAVPAVLIASGCAGSPAYAGELDAELIRLGQRFDELTALMTAAREEEDRLSGIYFERQPIRPEALRRRRNDFGHHTPRADGFHSCTSVALIREKLPEWRALSGNFRVSPERLQRCEEIVCAYDGWLRRCARLQHRLGLGAAHDRFVALMDDRWELIERAAALRATGPAGRGAKARMAVSLRPAEAGDEMDLPTQLAFSLVADALAEGGAA